MSGIPRHLYDDAFFEQQQDVSSRSAAAVVPFVMKAVRPGSVIDVGCGRGTWLSHFQRAGCKDILGLDSHDQSPDRLLVDAELIRRVDLENPPRIERRFDLAVSLEVAEHLGPSVARQFVEFLTKLAPVVLFSAAIPHQTGIGHVNEQWPSYWAELFGSYDYVPSDVLRPLFWEDARVAYWYRQNMLFFGESQTIRSISADVGTLDMASSGKVLPLVHPEAFAALQGQLPGQAGSLVSRLRSKLRRLASLSSPTSSRIA